MKISDNFDSVELSDPIFKEVKYYITGNVPEKVVSLLKDGGARKTSYLSEIVTHCIAGEEFEESDVSEAKDIYEIQAVTWKWVILSARCNTLLPVKGFLAERGQLFSGVTACVSQLNTADNSALWAMLSFFGGEMRTRLDASCTHLITAKPSGAKYERAVREKEKSGGRGIEIVTPDWVCDSVKGNVRCEEVLYHPGLLLLEEEKKEEPSAVDPLASSLANITGFSEPDTSDPAKRVPPAATLTQNVANLPAEQRMERLMEMLDQRKQQEQQLISNQQQLSNVQLQQQQLLQQQNLISHPQQQQQQVMMPQQQQQQQNLLNQQQNLIPQQQNLLVHQQNLHQNQQPGLTQSAINNQPQQAGGFNQIQQPMLQQQQMQGQASQQALQQQRLQLLQQQQFQQRLLAQQQAAAAGGGTVGGRVLLTPQQLQQRTLQQQQAGGPWRQRVIITEGGKQYVVQEAAPQQQQGTASVQGQPGVAPGAVAGQQQPGQPQQYTVTIQRDPNAPGQQVTWQQQQFHLHQQKQLQLQLNSGTQGAAAVQSGQVAVAQPQQSQQQQQQAGQVVPGQQTQQPPQQGAPQLQQRLVWQTTQGPVQRQFIHLDPQTHQQLQQMDPQQRQVFLQKLHRRQQLLKLQQEQLRLQQQQQQAAAAGLPPPQRPQLNPQQQVVIRQQQQQRLSLTPQQQQQLWQAQRGEGGPAQQQARTLVIQQQGGPQDQQQILLQTSAASLVPRQALGPQQQLVTQQTVASSVTPQAGAQVQQWTITPPSTPGVVSSPSVVGQPPVAQPTQQQVVAGTNPPQLVSAVSGDAAMRQQQLIQLQRQQHIRRLQLQLQQQQLAQQQKQQGVVPTGAPGVRMPTPTYPTTVQQVGLQQQVVGQQTVVTSNVVQSEDGQQTTQITTQPGVVEGQPVTPQTQQQQFQQLLVNAKTKTALANMLSIRLSGSGVAGEQTSAAGQLRLMTQQHQQHQQQSPLPQGVASQPLGLQAGQNVQQQPAQQLIGAVPGAGGVVNVTGATPQQQQLLLAYQQQQQRRALGSLANNAGVPTQVVVRNAAGVVQATYTTSRVALASAQQHATVPGAQAGPQTDQVVSTPAPPQQPATVQVQFYGHSPNIKVPGSLCLLGCVFYTMEYTSVCTITDLEKWHKLITNYGGEVESTYVPRVTHVISPHHRTPLATQAVREGKRLVSAFWLNDVLLRERMSPPWQALHLPLGIAYNTDDTQPLKKFIISSSGFNADEKERIKHIVDILGGRYTGYFTKENKILICRKTEGKKYQQARLWHTTIVNAHWLHEIMQGHFRALHATSFVKYQQFNLDNPFALDYSSLAHLMMAWKVPVTISQECLERGKILQQQHLANPNKRRRPGAVSPTRAALIAQEEAENRMERPSKRLKEDTTSLTLPEGNGSNNTKVYVLLSLVNNKAEKRRQVEELGGILTKHYDKVTHIVMGDTQRTVKLLCSVATVKYIVNEDWLADSYAEKRFLEPDKYIFSNTDIERENNFTFRSLLQKTNRNELLKDVTFYLSPGVVPSANVLEDVIVSAGGRVESQRRGAPRIIELNRQKPNSYIVLADMNDLHLLVELINARIDIYMPELVFPSILQQKLILEEKYKLVQ